MSDAAARLAQPLRDLINDAVQAAIERECPTPPPARVIVERPKVRVRCRPWLAFDVVHGWLDAGQRCVVPRWRTDRPVRSQSAVDLAVSLANRHSQSRYHSVCLAANTA
jgi:hypothetical protein